MDEPARQADEVFMGDLLRWLSWMAVAPRRVAMAVRPKARNLTAELVSLAGAGAVCAGVATWSLSVALIVAGMWLVIVGQGIERR